MSDRRGVKRGTGVAVGKLSQSRVLGVQFTHASLQIDHLGEITVPRLVSVKEGEYRLSLVDALGVGS